MGVKTDLDLLILETEEDQDKAKSKFDKGMIGFSQEDGETKKAK